MGPLSQDVIKALRKANKVLSLYQEGKDHKQYLAASQNVKKMLYPYQEEGRKQIKENYPLLYADIYFAFADAEWQDYLMQCALEPTVMQEKGMRIATFQRLADWYKSFGEVQHFLEQNCKELHNVKKNLVKRHAYHFKISLCKKAKKRMETFVSTAYGELLQPLEKTVANLLRPSSQRSKKLIVPNYEKATMYLKNIVALLKQVQLKTMLSLSDNMWVYKKSEALFLLSKLYCQHYFSHYEVAFDALDPTVIARQRNDLTIVREHMKTADLMMRESIGTITDAILTEQLKIRLKSLHDFFKKVQKRTSVLEGFGDDSEEQHKKYVTLKKNVITLGQEIEQLHPKTTPAIKKPLLQERKIACLHLVKLFAHFLKYEEKYRAYLLGSSPKKSLIFYLRQAINAQKEIMLLSAGTEDLIFEEIKLADLYFDLKFWGSSSLELAQVDDWLKFLYLKVENTQILSRIRHDLRDSLKTLYANRKPISKKDDSGDKHDDMLPPAKRVCLTPRP